LLKVALGKTAAVAVRKIGCELFEEFCSIRGPRFSSLLKFDNVTANPTNMSQS
jgi:hypothetical protein